MINRFKYPRSFHLPYSEKLSSKDDIRHKSDEHFHGKHVIVSIKMDGENTTCSNEYLHARSLDSKIDSEDRRWIENLRVTKIAGNIPDSYRICGENLFYRHTCKYENLNSLFNVFSIWENEICLSWEDTLSICNKLDLCTVRIIYDGIYDKDIILDKFNKFINKSSDDVEGFVIRNVDSFHYDDFKYNLSKFVRKTFELPPQHWRHSAKTINGLSTGENPWVV